MINWKDCILAQREYVWVAYSKDYPYLPVAVASTSEELAKIMSVSKNDVESRWGHFKQGKLKTTRYARVLIEE